MTTLFSKLERAYISCHEDELVMVVLENQMKCQHYGKIMKR